MTIQFKVRGNAVVAVDPTSDQPIKQADNKHPHFNEIIRRLRAGDKSAFELFDVGLGASRRLQTISSRVSYDGTNIFFDNVKQDNAIAEHLVEVIRSGAEDYMPVVKFWEKLAANPIEHSREQLFRWLQSDKFSITDDGDIIGYKGMNKCVDGEKKTYFCATHTGHGFVNGVEMKNSNLPAYPGDVVSMPRNEVVHDPRNHCSSGLHIGTFAYARNFGNTRVQVTFNPRDAVSVPEDEKIRVSKYRLIGEATERSVSPIGFKAGYSPQVGDRL